MDDIAPVFHTYSVASATVCGSIDCTSEPALQNTNVSDMRTRNLKIEMLLIIIHKLLHVFRQIFQATN